MNPRRSHLTKTLLCLTLLLAPCAALTRATRAHDRVPVPPIEEGSAPAVKISPDLLHNPAEMSVQASPRTVVEQVRAIVQTQGQSDAQLEQFINARGGRVLRRFGSFRAAAVELPVGELVALAELSGVRYISKDRPTRLLGHVSLTTGADAVRTQSNSGGSYTLDGTGIGIAVLDSGVSHSHDSFLDGSSNSRIVADVDFTGSSSATTDPFGHGTHVAALAAGNGSVASGAYTGVASNANVVNLRVLDEDGLGTTAGMLDALEWVMNNRATYNIRVVNISLGTAAVDSYHYDPLCLAVRSLVDAGVVVVAAAGNEGKNADGQKVYGLIHSPGIEPSAITVGASNTFDTDARDDDGVTTYSSRGPTRSYWTDTSNVVHHDNLVKPDLVAPGNKLVSAESAGNALVTAHPELEAYTDSNPNHSMMRLSGTSMATPLVSGAAALLLQANPSLTPNMVKMLLMYTAQPLAGFNMLEQGAGELNIEGAVRVATLMRTDCSSGLALGDSLLTGSTPTHSTTIAGFQFPWAGGAVAGHTYVSGVELITDYQKVYDLGRSSATAYSRPTAYSRATRRCTRTAYSPPTLSRRATASRSAAATSSSARGYSHRTAYSPRTACSAATGFSRATAYSPATGRRRPTPSRAATEGD
jgi:serine protease AprX